MLSLWLILSGMALQGFSGVPALAFSRRSMAGQTTTFVLLAVGSLLSLVGVVLNALGIGGAEELTVPWFLPWGQFSVGLDALGNVFLALIFVVPALGACYGLGYWRQADHGDNGRRLGLAFGVLTAAMALVVLARDGVLFLLAWEGMALAAFFAITTEDDNDEVRKAGWVYLVATHVGTLCLLALFGFWARETGSFSLLTPGSLTREAADALFVLAMVGFGFKAGLMPLHFWLPGAHAHAPSHVSAVLSGVMLKVGVYGILRITSLLPVGEWWGITVLILGIATGILGIAFALGQQDLKRLLAYSSIENIGIMVAGLGLALWGRYQARDDWVLLGLGGSLLHVWNHGLFKPLLFFNAGAVIHAAGTRSLDRMGGLGRSMPFTMALFMVGAVAICGLPPLNGFVGEWYLYLGFFHTLQGTGALMAAAAGASGLALIGALALACFVKAGSGIFQGTSREGEIPGHDPGGSLLVPMVILAALCVVLGVGAPLVVPALDAAVAAWDPGANSSLAALASTPWISTAAFAVFLGVGGGALGVKFLPRAKAKPVVTWDCGYARPTGRMQYTASSLTDGVVRLFGFILWSREGGKLRRGVFARKWSFRKGVPDVVLDRWLLPFAKLVGRMVPRIRVFQQGQTHVYVLYILMITLFLFAVAGFWRHP